MLGSTWVACRKKLGSGQRHVSYRTEQLFGASFETASVLSANDGIATSRPTVYTAIRV